MTTNNNNNNNADTDWIVLEDDLGWEWEEVASGTGETPKELELDVAKLTKKVEKAMGFLKNYTKKATATRNKSAWICMMLDGMVGRTIYSRLAEPDKELCKYCASVGKEIQDFLQQTQEAEEVDVLSELEAKYKVAVKEALDVLNVLEL